ncbi:putative mitochondrial protein [Dendrobium catenatum]|uniref:Putative mitochondrial protein n=1 Tax=Dendrobium catenatum TaxID=906689 RepID=A0A2I0VD29_9ASPA|nr:putative mitochondrial protein [Dendrobium catenatum]
MEQIETVFHGFFQDKWTARGCNLTGWPHCPENLRISKENAKLLNEEFTKEELINVVFKQGNNKSPGLDGITNSFFKFYWKIVGDDTWKAIEEFFKTGIMHNEWKDTLLVLIPKVKNPKQAAFLHGRSMSDHVLLAHEVFHKMKISKRKKGFMVVKLDMEQAYDSMCWDTLFQVLNMFGFPMKLTMLIMECIRNARFAFILNGKNSKWIIAENGFRQGCPLSPFLYVICSQLLSLAIAQRGQDLGIQVSCRAHKISHLLFADDVLLFSKATKKLAVKMNKIVRDFCSWTGLRINISKSQILFSKRINRMNRIHVMKILKFKLV